MRVSTWERNGDFSELYGSGAPGRRQQRDIEFINNDLNSTIKSLKILGFADGSYQLVVRPRDIQVNARFQEAIRQDNLLIQDRYLFSKLNSTCIFMSGYFHATTDAVFRDAMNCFVRLEPSLAAIHDEVAQLITQPILTTNTGHESTSLNCMSEYMAFGLLRPENPGPWWKTDEDETEERTRGLMDPIQDVQTAIRNSMRETSGATELPSQEQSTIFDSAIREELTTNAIDVMRLIAADIMLTDLLSFDSSGRKILMTCSSRVVELIEQGVDIAKLRDLHIDDMSTLLKKAGSDDANKILTSLLEQGPRKTL